MFGKRDKPKIDAASEFTCSWCADEILDDEECFAVGAKASADMDLQELEDGRRNVPCATGSQYQGSRRNQRLARQARRKRYRLCDV